MHIALRGQGVEEPKPCRKCGNGRRSETVLCQGCGSDHAKHALYRAERVARHMHPVVMHELLGLAKRMRRTPFVGL